MWSLPHYSAGSEFEWIRVVRIISLMQRHGLARTGYLLALERLLLRSFDVDRRVCKLSLLVLVSEAPSCRAVTWVHPSRSLRGLELPCIITILWLDFRKHLELDDKRRKQHALLWNHSHCASACYVDSSGQCFCGFHRGKEGYLQCVVWRFN